MPRGRSVCGWLLDLLPILITSLSLFNSLCFCKERKGKINKQLMGICWGSPADEPNPDQLPKPTTATTSTIDHLNPDTSFYGYSSFQTVASTNITWVSQVNSSLSTLRANNPSGNSQSSNGLSSGGIISGENLRVFTYAQLKLATHDFRSDMVVGRGGFGKVYKGGLKEKVPSKGIKELVFAAKQRVFRGDLKEKVPSEGIKKLVFAVKRLDATSKQGMREWQTEVNILGRLSHPNLVKLLGHCVDNGIFLVYEFMPNGSLNYHLFRKRSVQPLPWDIRFKVALGTAQGLAYMHTLHPPIFHRDFKSSNVLLDKLYNAKISDFGLAFLDSSADSRVQARAVGTVGYFAPEYISEGNLSVKSDVYSYGIVLLEMLTGLRAFDTRRPLEQQVLVNWVKPHLSNRRELKTIMDSRLEGKYPFKEASQIAQLAIRCVHHEPGFRPP